MGGKKTVVSALLLAVIIVAVVIAVKRNMSKPEMPDWRQNQQIERIDIKSFEVITERQGDWDGKYAPDASGRYKNPKTGEYTMVGVMKCAACGQFIPNLQIPAELRGKPVPMATMEKLKSEYKCPKCGKNPFQGR